jgi:phage shock protein A
VIDSLRIFESLKSADLPECQAKAIAQAIGEVTEERETRQGNALADKVNNDTFKAVIERLEQKFAQLEQALEKLPQRSEIAETKSEMLRWMFGFWVGQVGATIAIIKLLR